MLSANFAQCYFDVIEINAYRNKNNLKQTGRDGSRTVALFAMKTKSRLSKRQPGRLVCSPGAFTLVGNNSASPVAAPN